MTPQQAKALRFIKDYSADNNGVSPSYREIAKHLGVVSMNGVHRIVHALAERRIIEIVPDRARCIRVLDSGNSGYRVTLTPDVDKALRSYCRLDGHKPETVIAEAVRAYLGLS